MQKRYYDLLELFFIFLVSFGLVFLFQISTVYVLLGAAVIIIFLVFLRKEKLEKYGVTKNHWKESIKLSLMISIAALIFLFFIKPFVDINLAKFSLMWLLPYIFISVPLQEFVFRGYVQKRLGEATINRTETIVLASFAFAIFHYPSKSLIVMTFIIGLIWGYLFEKHKTLAGPLISHIILGTFILTSV